MRHWARCGVAFDPITSAVAWYRPNSRQILTVIQPGRTRLDLLLIDRKHNHNPGLILRESLQSSKRAGVDSAGVALSMSGYGESTQESYVYGECGSSDNYFKA